ncbi:pentapeptide repeat-containing protein [cyanobacterium endosymbiont of Rhopalodia gibberula]|uniref:pentapeptide repeat-containing protein n=1 Tax=cyanobacterium endosymbiont of Rhopalodia gibberula TaxID=1763363 RepID=UPI000E64775D
MLESTNLNKANLNITFYRKTNSHNVDFTSTICLNVMLRNTNLSNTFHIKLV